MKVFKNAKVYVDGMGITRCDLSFDERIVAIGEDISAGKDVETITLPENVIVCPGFVDEHIHGAAGFDTMDATKAALSAISNSIASEGVTSFLATTMTQSIANTERALIAVKDYIDSMDKQGARLLGVHAEGPFLSPLHIGAQPLEYVLKPDSGLFERLCEVSGGNIRLVTIAPELDGANEFLKTADRLGVKVNVGHSDACNECLDKAYEIGLDGVTHTYNAQRGVHHREIGVAGTALLDERFFTEVIADGIHVSVPALKLLAKNKPKDKLVLITDAMRAKNCGEGISELGGQTVIVKNGEARLENGALAGSVLKMNVAVKNMVEKVGLSFEAAIEAASTNPCKRLNIFNEYGSIAVGKFADFVLLDENFAVYETIRGGKTVFKG